MSGRRSPRWSVPGLLVAGSLTAVASIGCSSSSADVIHATVPTAEVKQGEFTDRMTLRGEIAPIRSLALTAPPRAGDLRIIKLAPNGSLVKKGDVVIEFDVSTVRRTLEEKRSELNQARAEIDKARAQGSIAQEESLTAQLGANYNVERARLDVASSDVLSRVEREQNKLKLADAAQALDEATVGVDSDQATTAADVRTLQQKQKKVEGDVALAEHNLSVLTVRAPTDGIVSIQPNYRASSPGGGGAREFRPGDSAWSGATIVALPDLSEVTMAARLDESDRSRLSEGLSATIRVEALPGLELPGHISRLSALAKPEITGTWPPPRRFDVMVLLDKVDPRLRPGMSATARLIIDRAPNALIIPAEALFQRNGQPTVYVQTSNGFVPRQVRVARRGQEVVAIATGLSVGEHVALRAPDQSTGTGGSQ
jgi:HlyD family secretion protein